VAIDAAPIIHLTVKDTPIWRIRMGIALVPHVIAAMAFLTQEGLFLFQQSNIHGSVRVVTQGAIFPNGLMFPQEGAALFGVAVIARVGYPNFFEQLWTGGPVGIMAIRADNLAFADRVMGILQAIGALLGMAFETDLRLGLLGRHRIGSRVQCMAIRTRHFAVIMLAPLPIHPQPVFMTANAGFIDNGCG